MNTPSSPRLSGCITARATSISSLFILSSLFTVTAVAAGAPPDAVPIDVTGRVSVLHADDFEHGTSQLFAFLEEGPKKTKFNLMFEGDLPAGLQSGATVRVRGLAKGKDIYLQADGSTTSNVQILAPAAMVVSGDQQTLVIVANFTDANVGCSTGAIQDIMFTDPKLKSIDDLYRTTSFDQVSFTGKVAGPFPINVSSTSACNVGAWADAAEAEAKAANIDISQYPRRVYVLPANNGCGYTGLGQVGGSPSRAWIFDCSLPDAYGHELGHNLGMGHAATLSSEYGDATDIMGASGFGLRQINGPHMEQMGWLPPDQIQAITADGNYRLAPIEADPFNVSAPQLLKIAKPDTGEFYYLSYRQPIGFDSILSLGKTSGVTIHKYYGDYSAKKTYLLKNLTDGTSFGDTTNGISITQTNHGSDGVNFQVKLDAVCTIGRPSLTITPNVQSGAPGTSLGYSVSVTNTDQSSCPLTTLNLGANLPSGWTGNITPTSLTLAPGQAGTATLAVTSPASLNSGDYGVSVNANDPTKTGHSNTAIATYSITAGCTRNPVTLALTPTSQINYAGATLNYSMTVSNNDSSGCGASTLNLSNTLPSGWSGLLSTNSLTLYPGQSGSAKLSVTSAATALVGGYSVAVKASDNAVATHSASSTVIFSVLSDTQAPTVPTGLTGTAVKVGKQLVASLSWNASTDNVGVTGYEVWRNGVNLGAVSTAAFTDKSITTGITYNYSVKAFDTAANVSGASSSVGVTAATGGKTGR